MVLLPSSLNISKEPMDTSEFTTPHVKASIESFLASFTRTCPPTPVRNQTVQSFIKACVLEELVWTRDFSIFSSPRRRNSQVQLREPILRQTLTNYICSKLHPRLLLDVEAKRYDDVLNHRCSILRGRLEASALDIPPDIVAASGPWIQAQNALRSLVEASTPSLKLACIANCCKEVQKAINDVKKGADVFFPVLVFVVINAGVGTLHQEIAFIEKFETISDMSEEGYYVTSVRTAMRFICRVRKKSFSLPDLDADCLMSKLLANHPPMPPRYNFDSSSPHHVAPSSSHHAHANDLTSQSSSTSAASQLTPLSTESDEFSSFGQEISEREWYMSWLTSSHVSPMLGYRRREGYLMKKGRWKPVMRRRWFVLEGDQLLHFLSPHSDAETPRGVIHLSHAAIRVVPMGVEIHVQDYPVCHLAELPDGDETEGQHLFEDWVADLCRRTNLTRHPDMWKSS